MPQIKLHNNNAERQKAYRQRCKEQGKGDNRLHRLEEWQDRNPLKYAQARRARFKQYTKRKKETRMFIAIDGEGVTDHNDIYEYESNKKKKVAPKHRYTLLGTSTGHYIEDYRKGLSTVDCLEFLLDLSADNKDAIIVGFSINYDVNMILKDLDYETASKLWNEGQCVYQAQDTKYRITWLPSKSFSIDSSDGQSVIVYDVFGFFQSSFIAALSSFGFDIPKEITEGKADRSSFTSKQKESIRKYNKIECDLLVAMLNKLRASMIECGFLPDRWHGAGAIASLMMKRNRIDQHNFMPQGFWKEIVSAYYGGRNQMLKQGELGNVWIHDINSAYPHAMHTLPTALGEWNEIKPSKSILAEYQLHFVSWDLSKVKNARITPFPFRHKGRIYWTLKGSGWYWSPEVFEALKHYYKYIKIERTIQFYPNDDSQPFSFIADLYAERLKLIKQGSEAQLPLKLGLNSLYGKVAQSIGYKGQRPLYQNHFWAGYLTSRTRARMFELAMTKPESVVFFATDGMVSTEQLVPEIKEKVFGQWEVKQLKNFFGLQSGVYTYDTEGLSRYKSRGFHSRSVDYNRIREIWRKQGMAGEYCYNETRFTGLGVALKTDFETWGRWIEHSRKLNFVPIGNFDETKRRKYVSLDIFPPDLDSIVSESYKLKQNWFEDEGEEYLSKLDQPRV